MAKRLPLSSNGDCLQCLEILLDVGPLEYMTGMVQAPFEFFSQDQGQKAAKHMAPDVLVALMAHRTGLKQGLDVPKDSPHLPELLGASLFKDTPNTGC